MLNIGESFRLKAGADFFERVNQARQLIAGQLVVQRKPIKPRHLAAHSSERVQRHRVSGG